MAANIQIPERPRAKEPPSVDIELRRKFLAKCRFRAVVRRVIANLYWLTEDEEVYEGDNIKKRVEQAMRAKSKKKTLLSLKDKALLLKPAIERTEQERKYIYRKIGGLKCFKRYPNHVKRKLAAATYFRYYGPNRVIVRQKQDAEAMYFVVTGEVVVSILIFDELLQKQISLDVFVMNPGDMFGEVSLLHNINRTATCTTSAHCEFLALMKQDFKNVLQASLQKQWDEVKAAMNSFTYFDSLDEVARREGCIVAKMKIYEPNDTILGDGVGVANFVYFVLSGRCQMIESLKIFTKDVLGRKHYSLYDPYVELPTAEDLDFDQKYFKDIKPKDPPETLEKTSPSVLRSSLSKKESNAIDEKCHLDTKRMSGQSESKILHFKSQDDLEPDELDSLAPDGTILVASTKKDSRTMTEEYGSRKHSVSIKTKRTSSNSTKILLAERPDPDTSSSFRLSIMQDPQAPKEHVNLRTYFMQVCLFNPGSSFGFGENMRDRRIVALNQVHCMLLPKVWLLQRNTANIWSRIQHYLEKKIPTKQQLFQEFVTQRRWLEWRHAQVEQIVARSKTVNHTTVHDVPYFIRMKETPDI